MGVFVDEDILTLGHWGASLAAETVVANVRPRVLVNADVGIYGPWGGGATSDHCSGSGNLALVYNDVDARVELTGTGFLPFTNVRIERSTDEMHWTVVRGAAFLELDDAGGFTHNDYEFVPCVENFYRVTTEAPFGCDDFASGSITPNLTQVWLKSVTRPFLNRPVGGACAAMGDLDTELLVSLDGVTRPSRATPYPIINRTLPVGVTDLALGRAWTLRTRTWTLTAHRLMDYLFASGDIIFIQVPCGDCAQTIENGYVIAFDPTYRRHHRHRNRVVWETPVQEVAPPGPDIAYREATWATVLAQFGTWQNVIDANPTWAHVLALLPDPSEVIVP